MSGHVHIAGRCRQTAYATRMTGTTNHTNHGRNTKAANSRMAGGGYRLSTLMSTWYGSPVSCRAPYTTPLSSQRWPSET